VARRDSVFAPLISFALIAGLVALITWLRWHSNQSQTPLAGGWEKLDGCRLVDDRANDGDSFRVSHGSKTFTVRLYFVDCPEKEWRRDNEDRLRDQSKYFGLPDLQRTVEIGLSAREFTLHRLRKPFTVVTKWEHVFDSMRVYGFVLASPDDTAPPDLAAALVDRGLARIHTKGSSFPGGGSERETLAQLRERERAARSGEAGAWRR
jgi:endonuclease YncB( thermonuclease family)